MRDFVSKELSEIINMLMKSLNSAETYFHKDRILEEQVKQPRHVFGPMQDRPEKWDYTDIRDIKDEDLAHLIEETIKNLDKELFKIIPDTAIHAALDFAIGTYDFGRFKSKINAPTYKILCSLLMDQLK